MKQSIFHRSKTRSVSSFLTEYQTYYVSNSWFVARRLLIKAFLRKFPANSILEVGANTGENIRQLGLRNCIGIEPSKELVKRAKELGTDVRMGDAHKLQFKDESFDCVLALDVLEHLDDDLKATEEACRVLRKGGYLFVTVPAFMFLWSSHDIVNEHKRRYTKKSLKRLLQKGGFKIILCSYWNFFLFLPFAILKIFKRVTAKRGADFLKIPPWLNSLFLMIFRLENYLLLHNIRLPFGVSVFCVAKKC